MNRHNQNGNAFLQNRAKHYRQLAERQTDEKLATYYRHLADVYDRRNESDRLQERRGAHVVAKPALPGWIR